MIYLQQVNAYIYIVASHSVVSTTDPIRLNTKNTNGVTIPIIISINIGCSVSLKFVPNPTGMIVKHYIELYIAYSLCPPQYKNMSLLHMAPLNRLLYLFPTFNTINLSTNQNNRLRSCPCMQLHLEFGCSFKISFLNERCSRLYSMMLKYQEDYVLHPTLPTNTVYVMKTILTSFHALRGKSTERKKERMCMCNTPKS